MCGLEHYGPRGRGRADGHGLGVETERARLFDRLLRRLVGLSPRLVAQIVDHLLDGGRGCVRQHGERRAGAHGRF